MQIFAGFLEKGHQVRVEWWETAIFSAFDCCIFRTFRDKARIIIL